MIHVYKILIDEKKQEYVIINNKKRLVKTLLKKENVFQDKGFLIFK